MKKKIIVICGTGVATSTLVRVEVTEWLQKHGLLDQVEISQGMVAEQIPKLPDYDIVISTTAVPAEFEDKTLLSMPVITKMGVDEFWDSLRAMLDA